MGAGIVPPGGPQIAECSALVSTTERGKGRITRTPPAGWNTDRLRNSLLRNRAHVRFVSRRAGDPAGR